MERFVFEAFGFPVLLHDVPVSKTSGGEEFLDINMKILEESVAKTLIKSNQTITGVKLKFLRNFLKLSLRSLGSELDVPHTSLKLWEDAPGKETGLELNKKNRLKYLVLMHLQGIEQKEFSREIFDTVIPNSVNEGPLVIVGTYKYGA